jgi:predicted ArsR family transcriptional regulator
VQSGRTMEELYRSAVAGLYARLRSNYDFLYERLGNEGIELIAEMSRRYGLEIAERAKKRLKENDVSSVAKYLVRIFETVGWNKGEEGTVEMSETKAIIRANECPLHFDKPEMCLAHTTMEKTVVETLNPQLTYHIGKSIPAGDPYCEHIVQRKEV